MKFKDDRKENGEILKGKSYESKNKMFDQIRAFYFPATLSKATYFLCEFILRILTTILT